MIAIPAIDLREGACVQLVGGSYEQERVRLDDPVAAARRWRELGFRQLHVVDLDAATERGCNDDVVARLLGDSAGVAVQVGGGVRSLDRARNLLAAGASRVVVGTRALEDRAWLADLTRDQHDRVVVAVDIRESRPLLRGWTDESPTDIATLVDSLNEFALAALLVTAVHVEGSLAGPDLTLLQSVVRVTRHRVIGSGGIATLDDLRALERIGVWGAVIGMALYTGHMDAAACAAAFGGSQ